VLDDVGAPCAPRCALEGVVLMKVAQDMTPGRPERVQELLKLALAQPERERAAWLARQPVEDHQVRAEVQALLAVRAQKRGGTELPVTDMRSQADSQAAPSALSAALQPAGPTWGTFLLLEEIGRGAFGVVYRAWDPALERDVALKLIDVGRLPAHRGDTLLREGRMLARVRHPNVVTVYSTQRLDTKVGLAMEYVRGRTLSRALMQSGPLGAEEAAVIGITLCDALAAVHRTGLVHRDVKASNVMREDGGRIVLMDFGAGHDIEPERTHASMIAGTPPYMSPEVLLGAPATPASDIYSLGVLLFHLVTGEFPVEGTSMESFAAAHRHGTRRPLGDVRPDLPERSSGPSRVH
jgi:eukaryotic-like serine/threonine-protein kinase